MPEQEKALEELKTAKAELEDILRQLREEEMKQLLASLIARMQKVLVVQREIYDGTTRLDKVPVAERSHGHEIESGRLSARERSIVHDVEEALRLLREEGSAVAMPEALQQVHDDMQQIEQRLGQGKTEVVTQVIETDVIKELEEIVDAFKKAKELAENKKKPPSPPPGGEPQDPPLIEKIAELKMIKAPAGAREPPHRALQGDARTGPRADDQRRSLRCPAVARRTAETGLSSDPRFGFG